jgi:hypothetical protein
LINAARFAYFGEGAATSILNKARKRQICGCEIIKIADKAAL